MDKIERKVGKTQFMKQIVESVGKEQLQRSKSNSGIDRKE